MAAGISAMVLRMLLALVLAPARGADVDCLPNAIPLASRTKLVNMLDEQVRPLGIWWNQWTSGRLVAEIATIIAHELLGYVTVTDARDHGGEGSFDAFYAVSGCKNPAGVTATARGCGALTSDWHVALETWGGVYESTYLDFVDLYPAIAPIFLGGMGYTGRQTFYILDAQLEAAWNAQGMSLDWYRSYNVSWYAPWVYFDAPSDIVNDTDQFLDCSATQMGRNDTMTDFLQVTDDVDGVEIDSDGNVRAKCFKGIWWLAPSCRDNITKCIFTYSGGDGWGTTSFMQKAVAYDIPLGIATAKDLGTYSSLARKYSSAFYWWQPDATFLDLHPREVAFEPHDKQAWAQGDQRTASAEVTLHKFTWHELSQAAPDMEKVISNMHITMKQINHMLEAKTNSPDLSDRAVACNWMNDNPSAWQAWVPLQTACVQGQGLVDSSSHFVNVRDNATTCQWCAQGRYSVGIDDSSGLTYICLLCNEGSYQGVIGQDECDVCEPGQFSHEVGQSECSRCNIGYYQPQTNQTECIPCDAPKTTMVLGAQAPLECVCPKDTYELFSGECQDCSKGLECAVNSKERNLPFPNGTASCDGSRTCAYPVPLAGYYTTYADPLVVYECLDQASCPGGEIEKCGEHMLDIACGVCEDGYFRADSGCSRCLNEPVTRLLFPVMPILLGPPIVVALYMTSRDGVEKWGTPSNQLACVGYTMLVYCQSIAMFVNFKVELPQATSEGSNLGWSTYFTNLLNIFRIQCAVSNFEFEFIIEIMLPIFVFVFFVFTYAVSVWATRWGPRFKMKREMLQNCYGSLLFTFYISILSQSLSLFQCYDHPEPNDEQSMRSSPSIRCFGVIWIEMLAFAIPSVLIFCVATLATLAWVLYVAPNKFQEESFRMKWKFALIKFRPSVWWWGIVVLFKGLFLNLTTVIWQDGTEQIAWITVGILTYTGLTYGMLPWRSFVVSCLEAMQHCFLVFLVAFMPHFISADEGESDNLDWVLLCVVWLPLLMTVMVGLNSFRIKFRECRNKKQHHPLTDEELKDTCQVFSKMFEVDDWPAMMTAMKTMSDTDVRVLSRARDIIVNELAVDWELQHCQRSLHLSHRTDPVLRTEDRDRTYRLSWELPPTEPDQVRPEDLLNSSSSLNMDLPESMSSRNLSGYQNKTVVTAMTMSMSLRSSRSWSASSPHVGK